MKWPEPKKIIPPGHYTFTLNKEPELKTNDKGTRRLILYVVGDPGNHQHMESFVPWVPEYEDLCRALNVEHGRDIQMEGASFEADIIHEANPKEPSKSYARLKNIMKTGEFMGGEGPPDEEDDIPF